MDAAHRHGDLPNEARIGSMLLESYLARGEVHAADRLLRRMEAKGLPREAELAKAALFFSRGDTDAARAALSRAPDDARRAVAEANLVLDEDPRRAAEMYEAAGARAKASGSPATEGIALANAGIAAMRDELDVAHDRLEAAVQVLRASGDERAEARALTRLGGVHLAWRDARRACEYLEDALSRFRDLGDAHGEAEVLLRLAQAYLDVGDPEKARDDAERALVLARDAGDESAAGEAISVKTRAERELGS
jgi:pentatricopeptide repeat protein